MKQSAAIAIHSNPYDALGALTAGISCTIPPARVLEKLPAGVVVLDGAGCVSGCNPAAMDLLGALLAGESWQDVITRAFVPDGVTAKPLLRDGRRVHVATRALAPQPGQIVLLVEDTGQTDDPPLASSDEVAALLAHQVRTPLAAAVLYAGQMMRPQLETGERLRLAGKLCTALAHLERLVNDILLCVRAGRLEKKPLPLAGLIRELRELAEPLLCERGCRLTCPDEIPPIELLAHGDALLAALLNLIVNALEACGHGGHLELSVRATGAGEVELALSDNGPGVPDGLKARIFEPFFTARANGTGLGLAVVRCVARAHGGDVYYTPRTGGGAEFTLRIPFHKESPMTGNGQRVCGHGSAESLVPTRDPRLSL